MAVGEKAGKVVDALDHPLPFVFFLGLALLGMYAVFTHIAKSLGAPGPAGLIQHP